MKDNAVKAKVDLAQNYPTIAFTHDQFHGPKPDKVNITGQPERPNDHITFRLEPPTPVGVTGQKTFSIRKSRRPSASSAINLATYQSEIDESRKEQKAGDDRISEKTDQRKKENSSLFPNPNPNLKAEFEN
jgi:hypothetical protein